MNDIAARPPGIFSGQVLRRLLLIFVPAAVLTGAVVLALYYQDLTNEYALFEQAGTYRVALQADIIRREVKSVESDLLYLANQAVLRNFLAGSAASRKELENEYVLFCRQRGVYDQIRYLDATGNERIRINYHNGRPVVVPPRELQAKAGRYYFQQTWVLGRADVFLSPFDLNVEHDAIEKPLKPMIRFATVVFDRRGVKRGILILNYLGAGLIDKLARASVGFPGSVWLVNRKGYFLRGPTSQDEWGFMLGHDRKFATYFADEWPHVAGAPKGRLQTDHGLFLFSTLSLRAGLPTPQLGQTSGAGNHRTDFWGSQLTVVARIPVSVLHGRAGLLLERLLLLYGVVLVLVLSLSWYLAYIGVLRRNHERHLADSAARLRCLSTQLLTAQEDERRSLSRDLHDELGQVVTSVTLDLQRAAQADDRQRKNELIGRAFHGAGCLLDRIHEISTRLRPTLLDDLGLKDAVQSLLSDYEHRTGIAVRADLSLERAGIPSAISENVYRILQEALTNVSKHARTEEVVVTLRAADGVVVLTVRDQGAGLAPDALDGKRLGLLGMRERTELLDGVFQLKSEPGAGTEVHVTIPLTQA